MGKRKEIDIERMRELLAETGNVSKTATALGTTPSTIKARCLEYGVPYPKQKNAFEGIEKLDLNAYTTEELAEKFGVSVDRMRCKLYNLRHQDASKIKPNRELAEIRKKSRVVEKEMEARNAGMSYGQMQAKKRMEEVKKGESHV